MKKEKSNLYINIGNSNIRIGYFKNKKLKIIVRDIFEFKNDDWFKNLKKIFNDIKKMIEIKNAYISSTNSLLKEKIIFILNEENINHKFIKKSDVKNISFNLINPKEEIGQDLLAQMVTIDDETIVISLGTATVIYYINEKLEFIGCSISLGIQKIIDNINLLTAIKIKDSEIVSNKKSLGVSTNQALSSGILNSIKYHVDKIREEYNVSNKCKIIFTGGNSKFINFKDWTKIDDLEIRGLIKLFEDV